MDLQAIGARIKATREAKGMTQEDFAAALDLSRNHISVIERGVKAPHAGDLCRYRKCTWRFS